MNISQAKPIIKSRTYFLNIGYMIGDKKVIKYKAVNNSHDYEELVNKVATDFGVNKVLVELLLPNGNSKLFDQSLEIDIVPVASQGLQGLSNQTPLVSEATPIPQVHEPKVSDDLDLSGGNGMIKYIVRDLKEKNKDLKDDLREALKEKQQLSEKVIERDKEIIKLTNQLDRVNEGLDKKGGMNGLFDGVKAPELIASLGTILAAMKPAEPTQSQLAAPNEEADQYWAQMKQWYMAQQDEQKGQWINIWYHVQNDPSLLMKIFNLLKKAQQQAQAQAQS